MKTAITDDVNIDKSLGNILQKFQQFIAKYQFYNMLNYILELSFLDCLNYHKLIRHNLRIDIQ